MYTQKVYGINVKETTRVTLLEIKEYKYCQQTNKVGDLEEDTNGLQKKPTLWVSHPQSCENVCHSNYTSGEDSLWAAIINQYTCIIFFMTKHLLEKDERTHQAYFPPSSYIVSLPLCSIKQLICFNLLNSPSHCTICSFAIFIFFWSPAMNVPAEFSSPAGHIPPAALLLVSKN